MTTLVVVPYYDRPGLAFRNRVDAVLKFAGALIDVAYPVSGVSQGRFGGRPARPR